ncbi:hypothetical protein DFH11DRAFT_637230 [Phellopilus nigrolimitatus]|nr:hypothetical protein DFH11DRAFT_637230 [Phellopilus nigrolimitatus]
MRIRFVSAITTVSDRNRASGGGTSRRRFPCAERAWPRAACPAATWTGSASRSGALTVCYRCRKKMERIERHSTLDSVSASQQAQMIAHRSSHPTLAHSQFQTTLAHSVGQSQHASVCRARARTRQDTPLVDHHTRRTQSQAQMLSPRPASHYREHERDQERRTDSIRSRSSSPVSAYASAATSGRMHPAESAHLNQGQTYSSAATKMKASGLASQNAHRRPQTPPYINSISTREQYANGSSSRALPHQHSQSHAWSAAAITGGGTGSRS